MITLKECPKCHKKVDPRGFNRHVDNCKAQTNGVSVIERYNSLLSQVETCKQELLAEQNRLNEAAKSIDLLLGNKT